MKEKTAASLARLASWLLLAAIVGTSLFTRSFVKEKLGPFYILEWVALVSFFLYLPSKKPLPKFKTPLFWMAPFITWGFLRLGLDLLNYSENPNSIPMERVLKYSLLFVYPLIWLTLGWLQRACDPKMSPYLILGFLASTLGNFAGHGILHISLGPLMAVLFLFGASDLKRDRDYQIAFTIGTALLAFIPFWEMIHHYVQRTNLIYLFLILFICPFLIRKPGYSNKQAPRLILIGFLTFILGFVPYTKVYYPDFSFFGDFSSLTDSFRKGDDRSADPNAPKFQFRSRIYMWENAWGIWKQNPVIGNGFNLEIPSELRENFPNIVGAVVTGEPPVSGPHNSYLQILARMGIIGAVLFIIPFVAWFGILTTWIWKKRETSLSDLLLFWICVNSALYATVHVGFESPHHAFIIWFLFGSFFNLRTKANAH